MNFIAIKYMVTNNKSKIKNKKKKCIYEELQALFKYKTEFILKNKNRKEQDCKRDGQKAWVANEI